MSITYNDITNDQGLVQDLRFISGQDSLSIEDATRLLNFALDRYSHIAITASGRWKFDDSTTTDRPKATTTITAGTHTYPLAAEHLVIDEVEVYYDGQWYVVDPIDASRDIDGTPLSVSYETNGKPLFYDLQGEEVRLYPAPSADATSLRVWFSRAASHFSASDTTSEIGIPSIHHEYLSLKAAERLALRTNDANINQIRVAVDRKEREIQEFYGMRDMNTPRRLKAAVKPLN